MKIFIFIVEAQPTFTKGKGSANIYFNWLTITAIYTQQMPP